MTKRLHPSNKRGPMKLTLVAALAALSLAITAAPARAESPIHFQSLAEVETIVATASGERQVVRKPAATVVPGTVVIYSNIVTNNGAEAAQDLVIANPVPEHMHYLPGSASEEGAEVTFSVDGGLSFDLAENLTVAGPAGTPVPAPASEYTHIRWVLTRPLPPGASAQVEFRARLQ